MGPGYRKSYADGITQPIQGAGSRLPFPVTGGIENHIRLLAREQARRGHDVTVLMTSLTGRTVIEEIEGVRVIKTARIATIASTPLSAAFFAWIRRLPADVTHLQFPYPPGEVAHLLWGRATVITYHSDIIRQRAILFLIPCSCASSATPTASSPSAPATLRPHRI